MCDHLAYCERNELKAEIDRLRAELASRRIDVEAFRKGNQKLRAELAEARRALLAGNDTVLANKKLQEDNAAKDARIAELTEANDHLNGPVAEMLARAERAEARIAELEAREQNHIEVANRRLARAERAEAELKAMRGVLEAAADALDQAEMGIDPDADRRLRQYVIQTEKAVRAALAPSPAGEKS